MKRLVVSLVVLVLAGGFVAAQDAPPLLVAQGIVDKVDKETLTMQPRLEGGKFGKPIVLRLTGTSKITTLAPRESGGKTIIAQRDTDAKDLRGKQTIAVTYTTTKEGHILLHAVVQAAP